MVKLFERMDDFLIHVNNFPFYRDEVVDRKKGIKRVYGRDGDREKINYILYSKKHFTKDYIMENVVPRYEYCKLCLEGNLIDENYNVHSLDLKRTNPVIFSIMAIGSIPLLLYGLRKKLTKRSHETLNSPKRIL